MTVKKKSGLGTNAFKASNGVRDGIYYIYLPRPNDTTMFSKLLVRLVNLTNN